MKRLTQLFSLMTMALLFTWGTNATAQTSINGKDCIGVWKTVDDESGRTKSHVEIFKKGEKYYAKIIKLLDEQTLKDSGEKSFADIKCDKCPSDRGQGKPIEGLEMVWDMEKMSDKWGGGKIMDPKKGKIYTCTMWMDEDNASGDQLKVRGWVAMFYRTQTWYRVK